jgi:hypothetical protein
MRRLPPRDVGPEERRVRDLVGSHLLPWKSRNLEYVSIVFPYYARFPDTEFTDLDRSEFSHFLGVH